MNLRWSPVRSPCCWPFPPWRSRAPAPLPRRKLWRRNRSTGRRTVSSPTTDGSNTNKIRIECAPASRASELIGKHGCVAGRVFRVTTRKTGNSHLYLCPSRSKCSFQAVAFARDRRKVGDLTYLHGKLIAVVGDVIDYRGHPEIVVKDIEQIRVAAGDPSPEFDAARPNPTVLAPSPAASAPAPGSRRSADLLQ